MHMIRLNDKRAIFDDGDIIMSYQIKHKIVQTISNLDILHAPRHIVWRDIKIKIKNKIVQNNIKQNILSSLNI